MYSEERKEKKTIYIGVSDNVASSLDKCCYNLGGKTYAGQQEPHTMPHQSTMSAIHLFTLKK